MLSERLFYFIHGLVTMFFLLMGVQRLHRKERTRFELLCGVVLIYWGVLELKDLVFYPSIFLRHNFISNLLILIDMTAIPVGCFFVIELLNAGWCTLRRASALVAPFLLSVIAYAIFARQWIVDVTFIFVIGYSICFLIYIAFAVRRYNRMLNENYSNTERVHVRWLKGVAVMLLICLIVWTYSCYFSTWVADSVYQLVLLTMWATALYFADRQQTPQFTPPQQELSKSLNDSILSELSERKLQELIEQDRIWLEPQLTLSDLAARVGTNRTYLSNYLNKTLHTTFYDYINGFRMEAAVKQLEDPDLTATMVEVAESCGFNSLSTFRRVFIRAKGCSFVEYRQRVLAERGAK